MFSCFIRRDSITAHLSRAMLIITFLIVFSCGEKADPVISVTSITLNQSEISLKEGESYLLTATVKPDDATDKTVTWSSSNTSVASVDRTGKVSALLEGYAVITATSCDKSATCIAVVNKAVVPVETISVTPASVKLRTGETKTLSVEITPPEAAATQTVSWRSTNPSVASVDSKGLVKAVAEGTTSILAEADGKSATCEVTVSNTTTGDNEGTSDESWD